MTSLMLCAYYLRWSPYSFQLSRDKAFSCFCWLPQTIKKIVATLCSVLIDIEAKIMFVFRNLVTVYLALCCGVEKCAKMKWTHERSKWRAVVRVWHVFNWIVLRVELFCWFRKTRTSTVKSVLILSDQYVIQKIISVVPVKDLITSRTLIAWVSKSSFTYS